MGRNFEPRISSGVYRPSRAEIEAPISASGFITRSMGRLASDSSPAIRLVNGCAARMPADWRDSCVAARGSRQAIEPAATDADLGAALDDLRTERGHARQRRMAIRPGGIIVDDAVALSDGSQHGVTM